MRRIVLLLLAALLAGCGLGTLLGTGRATVDLGTGPAVAAGTVRLAPSGMVRSNAPPIEKVPPGRVTFSP